jgi:hypothetical protein
MDTDKHSAAEPQPQDFCFSDSMTDLIRTTEYAKYTEREHLFADRCAIRSPFSFPCIGVITIFLLAHSACLPILRVT